MVGGRRYLRRSGSRRVGRDGAGDAIWPTAVLHRVPEAGRVVRWLGSGLPLVAEQPECPAQPRSAGHGAAVGSGGSPALRPHHGAALRSGEPAAAWHAQGAEREPAPAKAGDAVRRNLGKIDEAPGLSWLQGHLDYSVAPLLDEPWVLDVDTTIKPLYGEQEGAELGYNPHKPGRPSHCYHTYMLSNLRLVLSVDVQPGDQHNVKHATGGLWSLLDRWDRGRWPTLLRGDLAWGIEPVMAQAEQRNLAYLFRLRTTKNVSRALQRAMAQSDWLDAGQGWHGKQTSLRLEGWSG